MITAVIITLNEEKKIADCINSLRSACDECIIVDAGSTDQTVRIARDHGAIVHVKQWKGYGSARNYGASKAKNSWILSLDADERLDLTLVNSLISLEKNASLFYRCNRLTQYCGQWIKHGTWHPEWKSKLYHRDYYKWDDRLVHEDLRPLRGQKKFARIKGLLYHEAYETHEQLLSRLDRYALLSAKEKESKNQTDSIFKRLLSPKFHFYKFYIWKRGFLDGKAGLRIARALEDYHRKKLR